jgi:glutaredoxin
MKKDKKMGYQLFSAAGCVRCKIIKSYMDENNIAYKELDIKAEGKDAFKVFYKENRLDVYRGKDGVEFPILYTEKKIFQGVGIVLAHLMAGNRLEDHFTQSDLCQGWVSGINLTAGIIEPESDSGKAFIAILRFLQKQGLKIQIEGDGRNAGLLESLVTQDLIHDLVFYLRGPADLYETITGTKIDEKELIKSLGLLNKMPKARIILPISAFKQKDESPRFLLPEEAASAAKFVEEVTGTKKQPFFIQPVSPNDEYNLAPLAVPAFFKYRTQCRRYMVMSEIMTE